LIDLQTLSQFMRRAFTDRSSGICLRQRGAALRFVASRISVSGRYQRFTRKRRHEAINVYIDRSE